MHSSQKHHGPLKTNLSVNLNMIWFKINSAEALNTHLLLQLLRFSTNERAAFTDIKGKLYNLMKLCSLTPTLVMMGLRLSTLLFVLTPLSAAAHSPQRSRNLHPHADPWWTCCLRRQTENWRSDPGGEWDQSDWGRLPEVQMTGVINAAAAGGDWLWWESE